jgi:hypothetical protein
VPSSLYAKLPPDCSGMAQRMDESNSILSHGFQGFGGGLFQVASQHMVKWSLELQTSCLNFRGHFAIIPVRQMG